MIAPLQTRKNRQAAFQAVSTVAHRASDSICLNFPRHGGKLVSLRWNRPRTRGTVCCETLTAAPCLADIPARAIQCRGRIRACIFCLDRFRRIDAICHHRDGRAARLRDTCLGYLLQDMQICLCDPTAQTPPHCTVSVTLNHRVHCMLLLQLLGTESPARTDAKTTYTGKVTTRRQTGRQTADIRQFAACFTLVARKSAGHCRPPEDLKSRWRDFGQYARPLRYLLTACAASHCRHAGRAAPQCCGRGTLSRPRRPPRQPIAAPSDRHAAQGPPPPAA